MTPAQITALRDQIGESKQGLADRLRAIDSLLRVNRQTVYRWEGGKPARTPDAHSLAALTSLWLHEGYPATSGDLTGSLTTNHSASSYGLPVFVVGGMAYGSGEIGPLSLGDAPASIVESVTRAGYVIG